ncbi:MAG TPA: ATP-binding protein [Dehalococcoidia bacterium]|nr:ATP-binding protein [Dehalococcoidia bacterium]
MFTRARLHLTLLYAALLGVTVLLVAGAIGVLAVREARNTDDRELQIRAASMAAGLPQGPPPDFSGPPPGIGGPRPHLEEQGLLEYLLPVRNGHLLAPPSGGLSGLPNLPAAEHAMAAGHGEYQTLSVSGNQVRIYSLPVIRQGRTDAVMQVARSRYFVNAAVTDLALIALVAGALGIVLSGAAGYWLAGRTLRPIARALERQRNFASDASHELRTPLTVMLTNAELLTLHPERRLAEYQDVVTDIVAETQRLSRLVSDLLTLARADQGMAALNQAPVDLSGIAVTVARQFNAMAADKGLALDTEIESEVTVTGDTDRLQQLAVILVDNAIRYTTAGSVSIHVSQRGGDAVLAVADTGPGIAAEHHSRLFERFYRTDAARSAESGGSGLGLALAKWIVESHHGRIELASALGRGSTFMVHLPVTRVRSDDDRRASRSEPAERDEAREAAARGR